MSNRYPKLSPVTDVKDYIFYDEFLQSVYALGEGYGYKRTVMTTLLDRLFPFGLDMDFVDRLVSDNRLFDRLVADLERLLGYWRYKNPHFVPPNVYITDRELPVIPAPKPVSYLVLQKIQKVNDIIKSVSFVTDTSFTPEQKSFISTSAVEIMNSPDNILTPTNFSTHLNNIALSRITTPEFFEITKTKFRTLHKRLTTDELSRCARSFAWLGYNDPELMASMTLDIVSRVNELTPEFITSIIRSYCIMNRNVPVLFKMLADRSLILLNDFSVSQMSNLVWDFAMFNFDHPPLFENFRKYITLGANQLDPEDLSNAAWGYVAMKHHTEQLMKAIATKCLRIGSQLTAVHLSNITWAFAKSNCLSEELIAEISKRAHVLIEKFTPQTLAILVWAFGIAKYLDKTLMRLITNQVKKKLDRFTTIDITNLAYGLGELKYDNGMMAIISPRITTLSKFFGDEQMQVIKHAYVSLSLS